MKPFSRLAILAICLIVAGCAGYKLGGNRPIEMASVKAITVPIAENRTLTPRAAALTTNSVVDAVTRDGSYSIRDVDSAQAELRVTLRTITYSQTRSTRTDTLRPEELEIKATLGWTIISLVEPGRVLLSGRANGESRFFVGDNDQRARENALPDALRRASLHLVTQIADGV